MNSKKKYVSPEIEITYIDEDILTFSTSMEGGTLPGEDFGDDNDGYSLNKRAAAYAAALKPNSLFECF